METKPAKLDDTHHLSEEESLFLFRRELAVTDSSDEIEVISREYSSSIILPTEMIRINESDKFELESILGKIGNDLHKCTVLKFLNFLQLNGDKKEHLATTKEKKELQIYNIVREYKSANPESNVSTSCMTLRSFSTDQLQYQFENDRLVSSSFDESLFRSPFMIRRKHREMNPYHFRIHYLH
jgi:hypothetical protein